MANKKAPSLTEANRSVSTGQRAQNKKEQNMKPSIFFGIALLIVKLSLLFGSLSLMRQGIAQMAMGAVMLAALLYVELEPYIGAHRTERRPRVIPPSTLSKTKLSYEE